MRGRLQRKTCRKGALRGGDEKCFSELEPGGPGTVSLLSPRRGEEAGRMLNLRRWLTRERPGSTSGCLGSPSHSSLAPGRAVGEGYRPTFNKSSCPESPSGEATLILVSWGLVTVIPRETMYKPLCPCLLK